MRNALIAALVLLVAACDDPVTVADANLSGEWAGVYTEAGSSTNFDVTATLFQADGGLLTGAALLETDGADVSGQKTATTVALTFEQATCKMTADLVLTNPDGHLRLDGPYTGCGTKGEMDLAGPAWSPPDESGTGMAIVGPR